MSHHGEAFGVGSIFLMELSVAFGAHWHTSMTWEMFPKWLGAKPHFGLLKSNGPVPAIPIKGLHLLELEQQGLVWWQMISANCACGHNKWNIQDVAVLNWCIRKNSAVLGLALKSCMCLARERASCVQLGVAQQPWGCANSRSNPKV